MKKIKTLIILLIFTLPFSFFILKINADELEQITRDLENLKKELSLKEANYQELNQKLENIKLRVGALEKEIFKKEQEVKKGEEALNYQKNLLNEKARSYYKNTNKNSLLLIGLFLGENFSNSLKSFFYQQNLINQDKNTIIKIVLYIKKLEEMKKNLEQERNQLSYLKQEVNNQAKFLARDIISTKEKIAQLQAKVLSLRLNQLNLPRTATDSDLYCTDERTIDPGFSPGFAFFSFGIPHFVGLNQHGAYGRAKAGQNYKDILNAYYQNISIECRDLPKEINVEGYVKNFEDYIKGVVHKEMGADLLEALKAQAVAARSYAFYKTSICASQFCQAYKEYDDNERKRRPLVNQAVDDTGKNVCGEGRGEVLISNGQVITAYYASTFGGYARKCSDSIPGTCNSSYTKNLVDTEAPINSFDDLFKYAYDRESTCFYSAQGWRFDKSFNNSAWLKPEEVADIVNTAILESIDSSTGDKLFQIDKAPPAGGDNWSVDRVKEELRKRGKNPFNNIYNIQVSADFNSGETTSIYFNGDAGSISFSGDFFKKRFNLRAPGYIQIVSLLYNVEKR